MKSFICQIFYKQRAAFEQSCASRGKEYPLPEDVFLQSDIFYDEKHVPAHRLDVYRPRGRNGEILPVIVNVHGGGLLMGNKEFNRPFCASLCEAGYLVFSIEYRLIPDCLFYDQLADLHLALDFIRDHLTEYGGDISHIYACGDSGGACLLTYGIAMQRSTALAQAAGVTPSDLPVRALGLVSGMFYTNRLDQIGLFLPRYLYGRHYKKSAFAPYVSPEHPDIVTSLPPSLLITSDNDNLQSYTLNFEKALRRHQMPHKLINYPKDIKAFYMKQNDDGRTVRAMDVLFPGIGEIIGGSEREADYGKLHARVAELGMSEKELWWYLDTRRWGSAPHSGFGLGFDRLLLFVTGMTNIRDVQPFPRTPQHADF